VGQSAILDRLTAGDDLLKRWKGFSKMISLISYVMAQLLVRDIEDAVVQALKQRRAAEEGTSVEEAHRRILRVALLSKEPKKDFKEFLLEMPEGGDDLVFNRRRNQPRKVSL
jgi:plasmid stability protein